jgi:hypothetical protein
MEMVSKQGEQMKCKCHPDVPFHWRENPRPSIFMKDPMFRAKGVAMDDDLTPEQNLIAYKQFGIFSRAKPLTKPSKNKHEL